MPQLVTADPSLSAWLARLVHEHRTVLAHVARREGLHAEDALDVVQDAFVTFLGLPATAHLVHDADGARKLLVAVTRNLARNARRRHALARPHDADPDAMASQTRAADELLASAESQARLAVCMSKLASRQQAVVLMRLLEGQGGDEVAATLGVSSGHVAVLLHRARQSLCACMDET